MLRRTPCIGICSTTFGDLVCRGCKRFAHEIVGWNGYADEQRSAVWDRLLLLRAGATRQVVEIVDGDRLAAMLPSALKAQTLSETLLYVGAYDLLRQRMASGEPGLAMLEELGLRAVDPAVPRLLKTLLEQIDREFYLRSLAHYERNFRRPSR